MNKLRINKGKFFNLTTRIIGSVAISIAVINALIFFQEPWSIFFAIAISQLMAVLWFASKVVIIDPHKKSIFDGVWVMGVKIGSPIFFESIKGITVQQAKTKQTMYSLSNNKSVIANTEYRAYLELPSGEQIFLISHPIKETMTSKVKQIQDKLAKLILQKPS